MDHTRSVTPSSVTSRREPDGSGVPANHGHSKAHPPHITHRHHRPIPTSKLKRSRPLRRNRANLLPIGATRASTIRRAAEQAERRGAGAAEIEAKVARAAPRPKEQSNFTGPDTRITMSSHGWIQGLNAHALVEEGSGVIVAQEVSAQSTDSPRLGHVLARPDENLAGLGVPEG